MAYKDKDKQREANAERQRRYKEKQKALLNEGVTGKALPDDVIGVLIPAGKPAELIRQPKRGKDIKTFADLPPDVQQTIDSLSMVDGRICQRVKANRTAIAINYQHLFPDRYNSTGVA